MENYSITVICLFLAIPLKEIELPMWLNWILTGFVIFHVGVHVALTVSMKLIQLN